MGPMHPRRRVAGAYDDATARVARGGELPSDVRAAARGEAAVRLRDLESDSATSSALPSPPPSSAKAAPAFSPTAWLALGSGLGFANPDPGLNVTLTLASPKAWNMELEV